MSWIREKVSAAIVIAAALASAGCSDKLADPIPSAQSPEPKRGGTITFATFGDTRAIDPANIADGLAPQILETLFAGLIDYDEHGKLVPDLAERWTIEDDGKTFRFFLREGVKFHDGEELTADDVKRSAERALHGSAPNPYATYFASIDGFAELNSKKAETLKGIEVEGKYVVSFHLKEPDATFLPVMGLMPLRPVCKSGGNRYSDQWHPCGAGPFKMLPNGWQHGHTITVVRHDGYYKPGLPRLDAVRWLFHENQSTQQFKFLRGDLDVLRDFLSPDLNRYQADPRWKPFGDFDGDNQILGEAMNVEMAPFDNIEIRRAVSNAIDRNAIREVRAAALRVTNQPVPAGVFGYDPTLESAVQKYDYPAALEHMKRAGYPYDPVAKTGGWPHVIPYTVYKQGLQEYTAQVLAQQLEKIGIRIEIRVVNYPTFIAVRGRRKGSAFGPCFWIQDYPDALSFLEPLFHSKGISDEDANNWSFYKNPRVDELIDRAHRELDPEKRKVLYTETQKIVTEDAPWAFTLNFHFYTQRQGYVREHKVHPTWMHDVSHAWIDRVAGPVGARAIFSPNAFASLFGDDRSRGAPAMVKR